MIYIWYFDRQDAIQSAGFNFIHDLPRFLVLLLIMQRLPYAGWGYSTLFDPEPGFSGKMNVRDEERNMTVDLEFDFTLQNAPLTTVCVDVPPMSFQ